MQLPTMQQDRAFGNSFTVPVGLKNLEITCFINSVLQVFLHSDPYTLLTGHQDHI